MNTPVAALVLTTVGAAWSMIAQSCCERHACENMRFLNGQIGLNYAICCHRSNPAHRDSCLNEVRQKVNDTLGLIQAAKTACDNNDDALIRDLLNKIRDKWLPKIGLSATGRVENQMVALGQHDWLDLSTTLTRPAQDGCKPVTLAIVSSDVINPEATGQAAENVATASQSSGAVAAVVTSNAAESYTACTFNLPDGTTFALRFGDVWNGLSLSGSLAIAQTATFPATGQANVGVPTAVNFTASYLGDKAALELDKTCPYNALRVDSSGNGTLGVALKLSSSSPSLAGFPQVGATIYFSLPVHMSADWTSLAIATDRNAPGETYTPTNHDVLIAADTPPHPGIATDPCADNDGNGIRDGADEAIYALNSPLGCGTVAQH